MRRFFALLSMLAGLSASVHGQQSPFLPEDTYDKLTNEISGDIAYDNLRSLVMYHAPTGESQGFLDEAQWVEARAKSYSLEEVKFIPLPAWKSSSKAVDQNWTLLGGELWLLEPRVVKLGDVRETPTSVADNSPTADVTAELIDVGEGTEEGDYAGRRVRQDCPGLRAAEPGEGAGVLGARRGGHRLVQFDASRSVDRPPRPDRLVSPQRFKRR